MQIRVFLKSIRKVEPAYRFGILFKHCNTYFTLDNFHNFMYYVHSAVFDTIKFLINV